MVLVIVMKSGLFRFSTYLFVFVKGSVTWSAMNRRILCHLVTVLTTIHLGISRLVTILESSFLGLILIFGGGVDFKKRDMCPCRHSLILL